MKPSRFDEGDIVEPPLRDWAPLLVANVAERQLLPDEVRGASRSRCRHQILTASKSYTKALSDKARAHGIQLPTPDAVTDEDSPIIMTGHQPVVYHAGLLLKEELLNACAAESSALAISVTIDTDEGPAGDLSWPAQQGGAITYKHAGLSAHGDGIVGRQTVVSMHHVRRIFDEMCEDLRGLGFSAMSASVEQAAAIYEAFAGEPLAEAHSVVRRVLRGHSHLEIPLSQLIELPEAGQFLEGVISQGASFASLYNASLEAYRAAHKIKNAANPFPNMKEGPEGMELPLWILGADGRRPYRLARGARPQLLEAERIVPRGSLVTLFLRGLCSDLFIHGLGGGRYDHFVDEFGEAYLGDPLPRFVVASRTRHLFPEKIRELRELLLLKSQLKEMVTHPEPFIAQELFLPAEEKFLLESQKAREILLAALKEASAQDRRPITYRLNDLNASVRQFLERTAIYKRMHAPECTEATLAHLSNRELPFFLE